MTTQDTFGLVTSSTRIFSSEPSVPPKNKLFLMFSPGLKFTMSLKIIAKNYFQLNCSLKFSVA